MRRAREPDHAEGLSETDPQVAPGHPPAEAWHGLRGGALQLTAHRVRIDVARVLGHLKHVPERDAVDPLPAEPLVDQAVRRVHLARPELDDVALVDPRLVPRPVVADDPPVEPGDETGHPAVEARKERLDEL